jgi:2-keto-4-pentenoate hydratase/2-oxohepta-3-ene-1,7-dioic acid hydratase in catechol pathway
VTAAAFSANPPAKNSGPMSGTPGRARVNGELMQQGSTADLLFKIPFLIEFISADITLAPGDIISTGTPAGVGIFRNPPVVLFPGDVVECSISKIGSIRNRFV